MNKKLFNKINDIYTGAIGHEYDPERDFLGAEELSRVITALANVFDPEGKKPIFFAMWNIKEFDNPTDATKQIEILLRNIE